MNDVWAGRRKRRNQAVGKRNVAVVLYLQAALCRCSQPLSGFSARCVEDEQLLNCIVQANPNAKFMYVVDTRPRVSQRYLIFFLGIHLKLMNWKWNDCRSMPWPIAQLAKATRTRISTRISNSSFAVLKTSTWCAAVCQSCWKRASWRLRPWVPSLTDYIRVVGCATSIPFWKRRWRWRVVCSKVSMFLSTALTVRFPVLLDHSIPSFFSFFIIIHLCVYVYV